MPAVRNRREGKRMQLITFKTAGRQRLGLKIPAGIVDIATAQAALGVPARGLRAPESMQELLAGGDPALSALQALAGRAEALGSGHSWLLEESALTFAPCVPA